MPGMVNSKSQYFPSNMAIAFGNSEGGETSINPPSSTTSFLHSVILFQKKINSFIQKKNIFFTTDKKFYITVDINNLKNI